MKKASLIIGILIILDILFLAFLNKGQFVVLTLLPGLKPFTIPIESLIPALTAYAALGTFLISNYQIYDLKSRLKKQSRNTEKSAIETQENSDKIRILQAKIETLEVALKEALSKK